MVVEGDRRVVVGRGKSDGRPVVLLRVGAVEIVLNADHAEDISLALQKAAADLRQEQLVPSPRQPH